MSTIRNSTELRAAVAARGFTSSPLIEEMLTTLEATERDAKNGTMAEAKSKTLRIIIAVTAALAIAATVLGVVSYTGWQNAVATGAELSNQLTAQRQADATHQKLVADTVAELRRAYQEADASKRDTSEIFSKQITQLLDENIRLKGENERLRTEAAARKPEPADAAKK